MLAGLFLLSVGGFAELQGARFPARSLPLPGTPVQLRVQDGVTAQELRAVAEGVRAVHRFLAMSLGQDVRGPVDGRIASEDSCKSSNSGERLIGEGDHGYLCVDTSNPHWRWLIRNHPDSATAISAHEYVHVWQAETGCLPGGEQQTYHWLLEGMASQIAWRALVTSGSATTTDLRRALRRDGAFDSDLLPLLTYEQRRGRTREYALWHQAVRLLLAETVARGAAPRGRPEMSLRRFCERVASGEEWRQAFRRTFGIAAGSFYWRFDRSMVKRALTQ
jgi:hypothetical protein